jgi:serine/threonine protein phosphatase 1
VKNYFKKILSKNNNKISTASCKYLIVPDIHGQYETYKKVDKFIRQECEDNRVIIFLGDYMDRGKSGKVFGKEFDDAGSYYTLNALLELKQWAKKNRRKIYFIRGNHEIFFEDHFLKNDTTAYNQYPFFRDSVDALTFAFQNDYTLYPRFETFLSKLLPYYLDKKNGYLFIHAGVDFEEGSLREQAKKGIIYWIRNRFIYGDQKLPYTVVFGHTPFEQPFMRENRIGLDSGIYDSGFINLLKIDGTNNKFIQL